MYRTDLRSKINFLKEEVGLSTSDIRTIVMKQPVLLSYSTSVMERTLKRLRSRNYLGLSTEEIIKMVKSVPLVLKQWNKISPLIGFLADDANCTMKQIQRMLRRYPQLLQYSIENKLKPKMLFLCTELDIDNSSDDFAKIIASFPTILWLTEPTIMAKIDFLRSELRLDTDNYELEEIVLAMPSILGLSLENNLKPKFEFFTQSVGMTRWELKEFVLYQPALLAYSLENRIKPRVAHMETKGISFKYCPPYLMSLTDDKFASWCDTQTSTWSIIET
mmetsp:Transcript_36233/g.42048  ORF Transcript_36233/g.42048 Transcript_36233/m.42048 type:complete len:276 (+) Transcript_36233:70-897(+)